MSGITLTQTKSGKWKAGGPALRHHSVIIEEASPNEAFESAKAFLDEYELFIDHLYRCCELGKCSYCETDSQENRETKGLRTGRRPRRYQDNPMEVPDEPRT